MYDVHIREYFNIFCQSTLRFENAIFRMNEPETQLSHEKKLKHGQDDWLACRRMPLKSSQLSRILSVAFLEFRACYCTHNQIF